VNLKISSVSGGRLVNAKRKKEPQLSFIFYFIQSSHFVSSLLCDTPRHVNPGLAESR